MMIFVFPVLFIGWKLIKKPKWVKSEDADLYMDLDEIEEYTKNYVETPPRNAFEKWFNWVFS
jgi:amino acid transporter